MRRLLHNVLLASLIASSPTLAKPARAEVDKFKNSYEQNYSMAEKQKPAVEKLSEAEMKKRVDQAVELLRDFAATGNSAKKSQFLKLWEENSANEKFVKNLSKALKEEKFVYELGKAYQEHRGVAATPEELLTIIALAHSELAKKAPNYAMLDDECGKKFVAVMLTRIVDEAFGALSKFVKTGGENYKKKFLAMWDSHSHRDDDFVRPLVEKIKKDPKIHELYGAYIKYVGYEVPPATLLDAVSEVYTELEKKAPNYDYLYEKYGTAFVYRARVTKGLKPEKESYEEVMRKDLQKKAAESIQKAKNDIEKLELRLQTDPNILVAKQVFQPYIETWKSWVSSAESQPLGELKIEELEQINENMGKINKELLKDSELNTAIELVTHFVRTIQTGNPDYLGDFQAAHNAYVALSEEKKKIADEIVKLKIKEADSVYKKNLAVVMGMPTEEEVAELKKKKKLTKEEKNKLEIYEKKKKKFDSYAISMYEFLEAVMEKEMPGPKPLPKGLSVEGLAVEAVISLNNFALSGNDKWKERFLKIWNENNENPAFIEALRDTVNNYGDVKNLFEEYRDYVGRAPGGEELCEAISDVQNELKKKKPDKDALIGRYGKGFVDLLEQRKKTFEDIVTKKPIVEVIANVITNLSFVYKQISIAMSVGTTDNAAQMELALKSYETHIGKDYRLLNHFINFPALKKAFGIEDIKGLVKWLEDNEKLITDAKQSLTIHGTEYGAFKDQNDLWGGLGLAAEEEKYRIAELQNKLTVTDAVILNDTFATLSDYGYTESRTYSVVIDGVLTLYERDPYLIPSYLLDVVKSIIPVVDQEKDLQKALAVINVFVETRYPENNIYAMYARDYFLDRFEVIADRVPELVSAFGHQEIIAEMWDKPGSYETHPYYQVKPPFLFGKDAFTIPTPYEKPYSLSLMAPGVPKMPGDPGRLSFGIDFFPSAKEEYDWANGQLYPPYENVFHPPLPPMYTIAKVGAERLIKEITGIFGIMPTIPYSSQFIAAQAELGAYVGAEEEGEPAWEVGGKGYGKTPTGGMAGQVIGGELVEGEGHVVGNLAGGGLPSHPVLVGGGNVHNFTIKGEWQEDEFWESSLQVYKQLAKKANADMLIFLYGLDREAPMRGETKDNLKTALDNVQDALHNYGISGSATDRTALSEAINSLRAETGGVDWDSHAQSSMNSLVDNMDAALAAEDLATLDSYASSFNDEIKDLNPDIMRMKGRLYLVDKEGNAYQVAYGYDTETEFLNYLFGEVDRNEIYTSLKFLGKEQFTKEAPAGGFNGAALGFTVKKFAFAGLGELVTSLKSGKEAYIEEAAGFSLSKLYSKGDATVAIWRGSEVPVYTEGGIVAGEKTGAYEQAHSVEVIHKKLSVNEKSNAAYQVRVLGGYPTMVGAELMTENLVFTGGLGARGGYGEFDLSKYYNLLEVNAEEMFTKAKNILVNAYGWQKEEADRIGWFLAGSYMLTSLQGIYRTWDAQGRLESVATKETLNHYGMGLLMLWAHKHNFMVGAGKIPGFIMTMDVIENSLQRITQNPEAQEQIIENAVGQINSMMKYDIWKGALGYGYTSEGEFRVYLLGSAELVDKEYAWGNLRSLIFFNKETYSDTIATLYRYEKSTYLDLFSGIGFPWFKIKVGTPSVSTKKSAVEEMKPKEFLKTVEGVKPQFVGAVVYSDTEITKPEADKWDIILSSELLANPEKSDTFYTRVAEWPLAEKKGTIEIGNKENYKEWEKQGFLVQKIKLAEKDEKLNLKLPDAEAEKTIFNRIKIMGGPTLGIVEATKVEDSQQMKELGVELRGWSVQTLVSLLETNKHGLIAGLVYGQKEYLESTATEEFKKKLEEWQFVLTGRAVKTLSDLKTLTTSYYFMFDYQNQKIVLGTGEDFKEWKVIAGVDWGRLDLEGKGELFKLLFIFGQKTEKPIGVGVDSTKVKKWLAAGGIAYEVSSPKVLFEISAMGGAGPYPTGFGPHSLWDYGMYKFGYDTSAGFVEGAAWGQLMLTLKW